MMELYLHSAETQACNVSNGARQEVPFEESRAHRVTWKVEEGRGGDLKNISESNLFYNPQTLTHQWI